MSQSIRIYNDSINEVEQLFALVGELGPEVPEEFACFRVTFGEAECRGRVGTTGIRIRDNDRKCYLRIKQLYTTHNCTCMHVEVLITSLRRSEIAYRVGVRSVIEGQPIIEPVGAVKNPMFDGEFGIREENTINNLLFMEVLIVNTTMLPAIRVIIRDDILPEEEECFDLSIFPVNPDVEIANFVCNTAGNEFVCVHTICIEDDDG